MKNYAIVGFIYSQACPLSCNFCCHTKKVVGAGQLTPEKLFPVIVDFAAQPSVTRFAFSGGDPFLFIEEIIVIMSKAREAQVEQPFHVVTSGYWAESAAETEAVLSRLLNVGMDALDVSYDVEHSRFVPPENIYRIASACKTLGIKLEVFGNFWNQDEEVATLLPKIPANVKLYSGLVMPIGAARVHFQKPRYRLSDEAKSSCGKPRVYDVAVYPDGSTYPCCSGGFNKEAKLGVGNVFKDSAEAILERVYTNFHARIAKEIGFLKLYQRVQDTSPELFAQLTPFNTVDSVCQICRDLNANDALRTELQSVYEEMEIEYALETLASDWKRLGFDTNTVVGGSEVQVSSVGQDRG